MPKWFERLSSHSSTTSCIMQDHFTDKVFYCLPWVVTKQ